MFINMYLLFNTCFLITKEIQILREKFRSYMSRKQILIAPTHTYQITTAKLSKFWCAQPAIHSVSLFFFPPHMKLTHVTWSKNYTEYYIQSLHNFAQGDRGQFINYFSSVLFLLPLFKTSAWHTTLILNYTFVISVHYNLTVNLLKDGGLSIFIHQYRIDLKTIGSSLSRTNFALRFCFDLDDQGELGRPFLLVNSGTFTTLSLTAN